MHKKLIQVILSLLLIVNFSCWVCAKTATAGASYSHTFSSLASVKKDLLKYLSSSIKKAARDAAAQPLTICSGASVIISGDSSSPGDTYLWQIQQSDGTWAAAPVPSSSGRFNTDANFFAAGLTNNSTTNTNVLYHLRRRVTNSGSTTYDSYYDITVQPSNPLSNNSISAPAITSFCTTGTVGTITGTAATGGSGGVTYQWQSSTDGGNTYAPISGANTQSYTPGNISTTTYYQRVASSNSCVVPTTSNTVIITVLSAVANYDVNAPAVTDFCASGDPAAIVGNTPTGGTGTYVYQWQSSTDGSTFTNISGATSKDYDPSTLTNTTYYRRVVSSGACAGPYISSTVKITINPPVLDNTVTTPPVTTFCASGSPGTITGSTPTGGSGTYTYQWQSSADGSTFTDISGATGKDYPVPVISITTFYRRLVTGIGCQLPAPSSAIKVTIQQPITNNNISAPAVTTFCGSGTPATITGNVPSGGSGTYAFQWQVSTDGANFTDIAGETSQNYTPSAPISTTTYYRRNVISGACATPQSSTAVMITIQQAIANNTIAPPAQVDFCGPGTPGAITGSLPTGGSGTYTYQWQSSTDNVTFTNIAGANGQNYTPPATSGKIYYRRTVTSGACSTPQVTAAIAITIQTVIANNNITAPAQTTFCGPGTPAAINGTVPTGGSGTYTYQWQSSADGTNFTDIAGATSQNYTPSTPVSVNTYYRRMVTSGVCTTPQPSAAVLITIQQAIANNTITPPAQVDFCGPGTPGTITGSLPTGGSGTYTYQWQSSIDKITFTNIAGANGQNYTPPATLGKIYYRRTVTSGACSTPQVTVVDSITIQSVIANNNIAAPAQTTFCGPGTPGAINGTVPTGGSGTYTYQWQSSTDGTNFTNITGATGLNYIPSGPVSITTYYRRTVTSGVCTTPQPSAAVLITIQQAIANNTITAPAQVNFCGPGTPGAITGSLPTGGGGTYTYQWQSSTDNVTFTNIAGANGQSYTPPATTGTFYYRRTVTSGACSTPQVTAAVVITIQSVVANNNITAPAQTTFCGPGTPGAITGSLPTGGSGTYTYQWQSSADGTNFTDIAGATSQNYTFSTPVSSNTYYRRMVTSGVCTTPQPTNAILITIEKAITDNNIIAPAQVNFCGPATPDVIKGSLPTGGSGTYTYQWQSSTDNTTFTNIAGATSQDYTPPATVGTFYYRRVVTSGSCSTPQPTASVSITIQSIITNNTITAPAITTFCGPGTPGTFTGSTPTGGSGTYTYQWQSSTDGTNFTDIPGATGPSYTPVSVSTTTYFRRTVTSGVCTTPQPTAAILITIQQAIANNTVTPPAQVNFCGPGTPGAITGSVPTGGDGSTYNYQWQSSPDNIVFTDIAGATGKDYTPPATMGIFYYRRRVSSGSCAAPQITTSVSISIQPVLSNNVLAAPAVTTFCGPGTPGTITGSLPSGGSGIYTYQWQSSTDGTNFTDIAGATGQNYTPSAAVTISTYFRRTVVSGNCQTPLPSTNAVLITITTDITNNSITPPAITNFCGTAIPPGAIVGSTPSGGDNTFAYQWQSSTDGTNFTNIAGATGKDYTPPATLGSIYYRRTVVSGPCSTPKATTAVLITIQAAITNNNLTAPGTTTFCGAAVPSTITGSTPAGGSGTFTYQWQSSADGVTFTDIPNATNKDYTPSTVSTTTTYRRVVISGNCQTPSISDNTITITINPPLSNNNITAPAVTAFCVTGNPATITGSVPQGGSGTYTYQWQSSTDNITFTDISGANGQDYTPPAVSVTTSYRRIVTSGACTTPFPSGSIVITITPLPPLPVPAATTVANCFGASASLSVTSPQSGITYNWYDSPSKTNLLFTGSVYVTQQLTADATFYVESSNGVCTNPTLGSVQVNIVPLPATPSVVNNSVSTCSSTTAVLSVDSPQPGITYLWYASATGGTSVFTGPTFTTPALTTTTTYYVEAVSASNCPSPQRAAAVVTVLPLPKVSAQGTAVCPGSTATLTATSDVAGATLNWYTDASGGTPVFTGSSFTTPALNSNTTYYVEAVNNSTGCISTRQSVQVSMIQPLPAPVVSVATSTMSSITFKWNAVSGATGYLISIDNGQTFVSPSSGGNGLTHIVTGVPENQFVTIIVKAIGNAPCEVSADSKPVTGQALNLTDDIFVPNAFTPNGDGKNDILYVYSEGIKTVVNFSVYDQWGELLFVSTNKESGWDGTYKGTKEPVGVYVYYLKAIMNNGHEVNKKGTITLLR